MSSYHNEQSFLRQTIMMVMVTDVLRGGGGPRAHHITDVENARAGVVRRGIAREGPAHRLTSFIEEMNMLRN